MAHGVCKLTLTCSNSQIETRSSATAETARQLCLSFYTLVPECGDVLHAIVWMIFIAQKCVTFFDFTYLLLF